MVLCIKSTSLSSLIHNYSIIAFFHFLIFVLNIQKGATVLMWINL
ncbi:hypothetical protein HMPREF0663_10612 [Hoylesella oralis ATCC 33269]|uniref:Uncharacterized protein n=1 Tax=Hoylesella oralis ATCC 33269 TaxID=873533 RepID=E7RNB2_9BACT|nr:hypothetical protein HMPREF0663_10612 [Hoylesella oralis ATCC 33269]